MTPLSNPIIKNAVAAMQQALKDGTPEQAGQCFEEFTNAVLEAAKQEAMMGDSRILAERGHRILTTEEQQFYEAWIENAKSDNPKQEVSNILKSGIPGTIIEDVYRNLVNDHPLLEAITFTNVAYLTKWIMHDHTKHTAVWGKITSKVTDELTTNFKFLDLIQGKLSCFAVLPMDLLELPDAPKFLDKYFRTILMEAVAVALEGAIVSGTGVDQPAGLNRDIHEGVEFNTLSGYPEKVATKVTNFLPVEYGKLVAKLVKTEKGAYRTLNADSLMMICNPMDYYQKVMPATTVLTSVGTYQGNVFPVPTRVIQSAELKEGKAILCLPKEYFAAIASPKQGALTFDDSVKFLEDCRTYKIKAFANGRAYDNTVAIVLDISKLDPAYITVLNKTEAPTV